MRIESKVQFLNASLLVLAVLSYGFWLTNGHFDFWRLGEGLNLTFNSMLEHMLQGDFDVDPLIIGKEGFYRDGRVYAYWGVFFAVIRWPLTLFSGGMAIDITRLSCWIAVSIAAYAKLRSLYFIFLISPATTGRNILYLTMAISILFGGAQISFLRPSLYQEVCLWAGALAAIFVFFAIRGTIYGRFTVSSLCAMAFIAGIALNARVSMGVGLYAAISLLIIAIFIKPLPDNSEHSKAECKATTLAARVFSNQFLLPLLILIFFASLSGLVNYHRWGNPLVFADYNLYLFNEIYTDRLPRTQLFGLFNLSRIPFGIIYYFFPIWVLHRPDGNLIFEEHQLRLMDATELPPSSFFLTDTLLMLMLSYACYSLYKTWHRSIINRLYAIVIGTGLMALPLLMLTAISMNFRYRIEFYPPIEFVAFLGFFFLCKLPLANTSLRRFFILAFASSTLGILGSHLVMILYKVSHFGPPINMIRHGVIDYYLHQLKTKFSFFASWIQ